MRPLTAPVIDRRLASRTVALGALALTLGLAACGGGDKPDRRAAVEIRGSNPSGAPSAPAPGARRADAPIASASGSGILSYDGYQAVAARSGDTVATLAQRVGLSAAELGAYNGLTPSHSLRAGDELVLPPNPGGYTAGSPANPPSVAYSDTTVVAGPSVIDGMSSTSTSTIQTEPLPGASSDATAYASASDTPDLEIGADTGTVSREVWSPDIAAAAIDRSTGLNADGSLAAPPSSSQPVPAEPATRRTLESPDLGQYQTGESGSATAVPGTEVAALPAAPAAAAVPNVRLQRPVDGPVAVGFNKGAGPARNDGVDFAAPAGTRVVAAADGEVALVSQSLGGLGTIVLLRHPNGLLTVYGRIDDVQVSKGDIVQAGQRIGEVSNATAPAEPRMHFEVRRGAESLDPMQFL